MRQLPDQAQTAAASENAVMDGCGAIRAPSGFVRRSPTHSRGPQFLFLLGVCFLGSGCMSGHKISLTKFDYVHPAVRWVYYVPQQVGWQFVIIPFGYPISVPTSVEVERKGDGCVLVTARAYGGCFKAAPPSRAICLDLDTGLPTLRRPSVNEQGREWDDAAGKWVPDVPRGPEFTVDQTGSALCLHVVEKDEFLPASVNSVDAEPSNCEKTGGIVLVRPARPGTFGHAYRHVEVLPSYDTRVVFGTSNGYLICIDLAQVPGLGAVLIGPGSVVPGDEE